MRFKRLRGKSSPRLDSIEKEEKSQSRGALRLKGRLEA